MPTEPLTDDQIAQLRTTFTRQPTGNWSIGDALACISSVTAAFPQLLDDAERYRALLHRIEWIPGVVTWNCPACGGAKDGGRHRRGCELAALIGHEKSATEPKPDGAASP
jgi:hypothetical protein